MNRFSSDGIVLVPQTIRLCNLCCSCLLFMMTMKRWRVKAILTEIQPIKNDKPYFRTAPSVLKTSKTRLNEPVSKIHGYIMDAAQKIKAVEASQNIEQVRNCKKLLHLQQHQQVTMTSIMSKMGIDTNFIRKYEIFPHLHTCLHFGKHYVIIKKNNKLLATVTQGRVDNHFKIQI